MSQQLPSLPVLESGARGLGIDLDNLQVRQLAMFVTELLAWNVRVNLTAVTDLGELQTKHLLDSLTLVPVLQSETTGREASLVDIGSGGGLPGIPLAIALPQLRVALVEATGRKVEFLAHVVQALELDNVRLLHGRAEDLARQAECREAFDFATARAVGSSATLAELLLPFVRTGGLGVLMKTRAALTTEIPAARRALAKLHGDIEDVRHVQMPGLTEHALLLIRKTGATSVEYPRRPGVPERRPIAG